MRSTDVWSGDEPPKRRIWTTLSGTDEGRKPAVSESRSRVTFGRLTTVAAKAGPLAVSAPKMTSVRGGAPRAISSNKGAAPARSVSAYTALADVGYSFGSITVSSHARTPGIGFTDDAEVVGLKFRSQSRN